jgi:hypothetical protein
MKIVTNIIFLFILTLQLFAQNRNTDSLYAESMRYYKAGNYSKAAEVFNRIIAVKPYTVSNTALYDGACIYSLNGDAKRALELLDYLASEKSYSNISHISGDSDLQKLHSMPEWKVLLEKVAGNNRAAKERAKKRIAPELLKVKEILMRDNGKLWGHNIWSDDLLVLDNENVIYSLLPLPESKIKDSVLYYKQVPNNILSQSNSAQKYNGKNYAVVLTSYLRDSSSTIIHELFHILQNKHIQLNGNPVTYLDNYDAREWLRLEYRALRNALKSIDSKESKSIIETYINDAIQYRKLRQNKYKEYLKDEIEIETCEGLANYTGFVLSTYPDKYTLAIKEIDMREQSSTYTRPFPYATGPAYCFIFDYLGIEWRNGLDKTYNFMDIYETKYLKEKIVYDDKAIAEADKRNNYDAIHKEELERKNINEKNIKYYMNMFVDQPTLKAKLTEKEYSQTFDMNGTLILKDIGVVYSMIKGADVNKNTFGNFTTLSGKEQLGVSGVLGSFDGTEYTFAKPDKIEGRKITGEYYEIELNDGWEVVKINEKGDLRIIKKQ